MKLILHSTRRCPFCIRVRILLHLRGIDHALVEEPMRQWTKWLNDWGESSGERKRVPVMQYFDAEGIGHALPESRDINTFLDALDGAPQYTPEEGSDARAEMERWITWHDDEMKPAIDLYKYGEDHVFDEEKVSGHAAALGAYLQVLEEHVQRHAYLVEERLTLADIAIIPFIRQTMRVRDGEFDMSPFPKLEAWTRSIIDTDWFNDTVMAKHPKAEPFV